MSTSDLFSSIVTLESIDAVSFVVLATVYLSIDKVCDIPRLHDCQNDKAIKQTSAVGTAHGAQRRRFFFCKAVRTTVP